MLSDGRFADLSELQTIYSLEDIYIFLEIISIDNHNKKLAIEKAEKDSKK